MKTKTSRPENITFSVDVGKLTRRDVAQTSRLSEEFFHMESRPDEIPASEENQLFILNKIPECDNVIKADGKVIGFTFIIPCNRDLMERFLSDKLSERELFEEVKKKITYDNFDAIYLCASFLLEEYRGRGLAIQGVSKSIKKIIGKRKVKPILFSWTQTAEGRKTAERIASSLNFELRLK